MFKRKHNRLYRGFPRSYTGFPRSCNNIPLRKVMNTCAVKIKWPFNVHLKDLLLLKLKVLLF